MKTETFFDVDAFHSQEFAQSRYLFLEFADEFGVGVLVDDGLADDLLRPVGVPVWKDEHVRVSLVDVDRNEAVDYKH